MAFGDSVGLLFTLRAKDEASGVVKGTAGNVTKEVRGMEAAFQSLGRSVGLSNGQVGGLTRELNTGRAAYSAAAAGITAVGGAITAAGAAIFAMTKRTSDAGSEIFDLHRSIGLTTETLSGLKVAAEESSSSLGTVEVGIRRMIATARDAATGSDEAREKLLRFGLDPQEVLTDLEGSLDKVIKRIGEIPEGAQRAAAAQLIFGRGGGELVATLESMGFSLENARRKADELGVLFSGKGARDADDFGDALTDLQTATAGLANTFAKEAMPEMTRAMGLLTDSLKENRAEVKSWGETFANVLRGATTTAEQYGGRIIESFWRSAQANPAFGPVIGMLRLMERVGGAQRTAEAASGGSPADWAEANAEIERRQREGQKLEADSLFADEKGAEAARRASEMVLEEARKLNELGVKLIKEAREQQFKDLQAAHAHELALLQEQGRETLATVNDWEERRRISHAEAARQRNLITQGEAKREADQLQKQLTLARQLSVDPEIIAGLERQIELLGQRTSTLNTEADILKRGAVKQDTLDRLDNIDAINRQAEALLKLNGFAAGPQGPMPKLFNTPPTDFRGQPMGVTVPGAADNPEFGPKPPDLSAWEQFKNAASGALMEVGNQAQNFQGILGGAFSGVANAIGSAATAWLVYGQSFGKAVKQALSSAMAAIATEAFVQALVNTAKGFAALAGFMPGSAALYFKAAGLWSLAAVGAGAGAAITAGGGGAGAGYGAAASAGASNFDSGRDRDRTRREARAGGMSDPNQPNRWLGEMTVILKYPDDTVVDTQVARVLSRSGQARSRVQGIAGTGFE